jgi:hypothetical protein
MRYTARVFLLHLASVQTPSAHNELWCQNVPFFNVLNSIFVLMIALLDAHAEIFR